MSAKYGRPTVYSVKCEGLLVDFRVSGLEHGSMLLYAALAIAAEQSFTRAQIVTVLENGHPFRCVNVYAPIH